MCEHVNKEFRSIVTKNTSYGTFIKNYNQCKETIVVYFENHKVCIYGYICM